MNPERMPDGRLRVPVTYSTPGGDAVDGFDVIGPDHTDYPAWERWMKKTVCGKTARPAGRAANEPGPLPLRRPPRQKKGE
jgi:hypothetical protein